MNMPTAKRKKRLSRQMPLELRKEINQERLLLGIAELVQREMERGDVSAEQMERVLGVNQAYVQGLLNGFADISVRELADVFSIFEKRVGLNLIAQDSRASESEAIASRTWTVQISVHIMEQHIAQSVQTWESAPATVKNKLSISGGDWAQGFTFNSREMNELAI